MLKGRLSLAVQESDVATVPEKEEKPSVPALYAGPSALESTLQQKPERLRQNVEQCYPVQLDMKPPSPPFEVVGDIESKGFWLGPRAATPEKKVRALRKQMQRSLVELPGEVQRMRPRLVIGEGQGAIVAAMMTFPLVLERACCDRAVTQQQTLTFRQAWAGDVGVWVIDPCVLPASSNKKTAPFEFLRKAYPEIEWKQPRQNFRAIVMSFKYLTPPFAEELAVRMGYAAERSKFPASEFFRKRRREEFETHHYCPKNKAWSKSFQKARSSSKPRVRSRQSL